MSRAVHRELEPGTAGGAYRPVKGLERVLLDGTSETEITFASAGEVDGKFVTTDAVGAPSRRNDVPSVSSAPT